MPVKPKQVATFSAIPAFVPAGVLYVAQDTGLLYAGTGASTGASVTLISSTAVAVNTQVGTTYTAALADDGQLVTMSNASACTFTIPTNVAVPFPVGAMLTIQQLGAGQITVVGSGGVTVNTPSTSTARAQYSTISAVQVAANTWVLGGDLT